MMLTHRALKVQNLAIKDFKIKVIKYSISSSILNPLIISPQEEVIPISSILMNSIMMIIQKLYNDKRLYNHKIINKNSKINNHKE